MLRTLKPRLVHSKNFRGSIVKLFLLILIILVLTSSASAQVTDSLPGRFIKRITTPAQFVSFDKKHSDRFFARDQSSGLLLKAIMTVPETDCFLANHAKDDL
jgi:hypothetical protein